LKKELLNFRPFNKDFESKDGDIYLFNIIRVLYSSLLLEGSFSIKSYNIIENKVDDTFFYSIKNISNGLAGHIGRKESTREIIYLILDQSRLKWAEMEGFNSIYGYGDDFAFESIGVFRPVININDFVRFISGQKEYQFKGGYITGKE